MFNLQHVITYQVNFGKIYKNFLQKRSAAVIVKGSITNKLGRYFDLYQSYDMESDIELTGHFNFEPIRDAKATKCTIIKIIPRNFNGSVHASNSCCTYCK